ncbi:MAG: hypothetical protein JOS17DRAFT_752455 [Linnemannia elongata]|nr:MAG: hypothetical protein JOS17DRAFT_752455 [Linnemannia elongata]
MRMAMSVPLVEILTPVGATQTSRSPFECDDILDPIEGYTDLCVWFVREWLCEDVDGTWWRREGKDVGGGSRRYSEEFRGHEGQSDDGCAWG